MNSVAAKVIFAMMIAMGLWMVPHLMSSSFPFSSSMPLLSSYSSGAVKLKIPLPYHEQLQKAWDYTKQVGGLDEKMDKYSRKLKAYSAAQLASALEYGDKFGQQVKGNIPAPLTAVGDQLGQQIQALKGLTKQLSKARDQIVSMPVAAAQGAKDAVANVGKAEKEVGIDGGTSPAQAVSGTAQKAAQDVPVQAAGAVAGNLPKPKVPK